MDYKDLIYKGVDKANEYLPHLYHFGKEGKEKVWNIIEYSIKNANYPLDILSHIPELVPQILFILYPNSDKILTKKINVINFFIPYKAFFENNYNYSQIKKSIITQILGRSCIFVLKLN